MARENTSLQENEGCLQLYISREFVDELELETGELVEIKLHSLEGDVVVVLDPVVSKEKPNTGKLTYSGEDDRESLSMDFPDLLADALGWRGRKLELSTECEAIRGAVVKPPTYMAGDKIHVSGIGIEALDGSVAEVVKDLGEDVYQIRVLVDGENELHNVDVENLEPRRRF